MSAEAPIIDRPPEASPALVGDINQIGERVLADTATQSPEVQSVVESDGTNAGAADLAESYTKDPLVEALPHKGSLFQRAKDLAKNVQATVYTAPVNAPNYIRTTLQKRRSDRTAAENHRNAKRLTLFAVGTITAWAAMRGVAVGETIAHAATAHEGITGALQPGAGGGIAHHVAVHAPSELLNGKNQVVDPSNNHVVGPNVHHITQTDAQAGAGEVGGVSDKQWNAMHKHGVTAAMGKPIPAHEAVSTDGASKEHIKRVWDTSHQLGLSEQVDRKGNVTVTYHGARKPEDLHLIISGKNGHTDVELAHIKGGLYEQTFSGKTDTGKMLAHGHERWLEVVSDRQGKHHEQVIHATETGDGTGKVTKAAEQVRAASEQQPTMDLYRVHGHEIMSAQGTTNFDLPKGAHLEVAQDSGNSNGTDYSAGNVLIVGKKGNLLAAVDQSKLGTLGNDGKLPSQVVKELNAQLSAQGVELKGHTADGTTTYSLEDIHPKKTHGSHTHHPHATPKATATPSTTPSDSATPSATPSHTASATPSHSHSPSATPSTDQTHHAAADGGTQSPSPEVTTTHEAGTPPPASETPEQVAPTPSTTPTQEHTPSTAPTPSDITSPSEAPDPSATPSSESSAPIAIDLSAGEKKEHHGPSAWVRAVGVPVGAVAAGATYSSARIAGGNSLRRTGDRIGLIGTAVAGAALGPILGDPSLYTVVPLVGGIGIGAAHNLAQNAVQGRSRGSLRRAIPRREGVLETSTEDAQRLLQEVRGLSVRGDDVRYLSTDIPPARANSLLRDLREASPTALSSVLADENLAPEQLRALQVFMRRPEAEDESYNPIREAVAEAIQRRTTSEAPGPQPGLTPQSRPVDPDDVRTDVRVVSRRPTRGPGTWGPSTPQPAVPSAPPARPWSDVPETDDAIVERVLGLYAEDNLTEVAQNIDQTVGESPEDRIRQAEAALNINFAGVLQRTQPYEIDDALRRRGINSDVAYVDQDYGFVVRDLEALSRAIRREGEPDTGIGGLFSDDDSY